MVTFLSPAAADEGAMSIATRPDTRVNRAMIIPIRRFAIDVNNTVSLSLFFARGL
jgi:hypothetical protein